MKKYSFIIFFLLGFFFFAKRAFAQSQTFTFDGSLKESYQCTVKTSGGGFIYTVPSDNKDKAGNFLCFCKNILNVPGSQPARTFEVQNGDIPFENPPGSGKFYCNIDNQGKIETVAATRAVPKPPTLQTLEIWFLRIVYVIWALSAALSFYFLVVLAFRIMISRDDITKLTEIRTKIIYYFGGLALVFLAVPILNTLFNLLSIDKSVSCYNVSMPGFQFFFAEACTNPDGTIKP